MDGRSAQHAERTLDPAQVLDHLAAAASAALVESRDDTERRHGVNHRPAPASTPWRFDLIDSVSEAGTSVNEDRTAAATGAAWILDGATGVSPQRLFPGPSDPAWFAATADVLLARLTRENANGTALLRQLVLELHEACTAAALAPLAETEIELPSASLAVAQLGGSDIDLLMLGDCKLLLRARTDGSRRSISRRWRRLTPSWSKPCAHYGATVRSR
jgi:hypothetical protein